MIKRSSGFFKIAFFIFCLFIGLFLISFSLTDIRNYVTAEICIFAFCISVTIIPLIIELIIYSLGLLTKGIKVSSKEEIISYKPMKNSKVPYTVINDNGVEKMMFFCDKGRITLLSSQNTKIHWGSDKDEISIKTKFGECNAIFKSIYGTKYENVECEVFTILKEDIPVDTQVKMEKQIKNTEAGKASIDTAVVPEVQSVQPSQPVSDTIVSINDPSSVSTDTLESVEEFDYSLKDTDVLLEETIRL